MKIDASHSGLVKVCLIALCVLIFFEYIISNELHEHQTVD